MADVVDHHPEALERPNAEQAQVASLGEDHLIDGFEILGGENRVADLALDDLLGCGHEGPPAAWRHINRLHLLRPRMTRDREPSWQCPSRPGAHQIPRATFRRTYTQKE